MMLGLNASIEAARLGNDGRGFAVVATQIRELSASSRKTSEDIKKLNDQINEYVVSTISNSRESLKTTEDQSAAMQELSATIQTMVFFCGIEGRRNGNLTFHLKDNKIIHKKVKSDF